MSTKFLIEAECAEFIGNAADHQLFWCCKCNTNKVDSLDHGSGRFFSISGHEWFSEGSVGDCKKILFAICPSCLSTDLWAESEPRDRFDLLKDQIEDLKVLIDLLGKSPKETSPMTWSQVCDSERFKLSFDNRDISSCIKIASELMQCSFKVSTELVYSLCEF